MLPTVFVVHTANAIALLGASGMNADDYVHTHNNVVLFYLDILTAVEIGQSTCCIVLIS